MTPVVECCSRAWKSPGGLCLLPGAGLCWGVFGARDAEVSLYARAGGLGCLLSSPDVGESAPRRS